MKRIRFFLLQLLCAAAACGAAVADDGDKTRIGGLVELVYIDNSGIGWTGSESTFYPRVKLDISHRLYEDALARISGEWQPTVSPFSRAFNALAQPEGRIDDTYLEFSRLFENTALRLGAVKVPFGQFDTLALNPESMPISFVRTREWDYGARLDARFQWLDLSLAIVNGEGTTGTDANSDKSFVARVVFPAQSGEIYPETLEVTNFPNPATENPDGAFGWHFGVSGYNGTRYSTPIKQRNSHFGADLRLDYSIFSMMAQYTFLEGGFTDPSMNNLTQGQITALVDQFQYSSQVADILSAHDSFPRAQAIVAEVVAGLSNKTMISAMGELYKPDVDSDATPQQRLKQRLVLGVKHDVKKNVSLGFFYVKTYDPAFGVSGNVVESDSWKGEDILTAAAAISF